MTVSETIFSEATRRIVEQFHPVKVILFGSHARGEADERSDIDLIVLCESFTDRYELEARMYAAMRGIPYPVDLIVFTPEEFEVERTMVGTVACPAAREGKVVYERAA